MEADPKHQVITKASKCVIYIVHMILLCVHSNSDQHFPLQSVIAIMKETVFTIQLIPRLFGYARVQCRSHTGKIT